MKKKMYVVPQLELTNLGSLNKWMKELGPASMPSEPESAPTPRRPKAF